MDYNGSMRNQIPEGNMENLVKCPLCNRKYHFNRAVVLDEEEERTTFHFTCDNCQASTLVFVSVSNLGLVSLGMATDLNRDEARKLYKNEAISTDNVLEIHEFLKNFKGSAKELI